MIMFGSFLPSHLGWLSHHQLYSGRGADIVMESFHSLAGMPRSGWIFPSSDAKCGHVVSIAKAFRKARIAAGLPESLCLCTARHGVGTELGAVMSLKEVMDILGHSDSRTALGYQHPSTANVQAR